MKKQELEQAINDLKGIKEVSDKQDYLVSSAINVKYNAVLNVLDKELRRMSTEKVEVNCPKILLLEHNQKGKTTFTDSINSKLQELVLADYKIIDYGVFDSNPEMAFIKYTT